MELNSWWDERRFGLLLHTSLSTVPAWAPIGQYPEFYQAHLDGTARDVMLHPSPLVETIAHHRDRWEHIDDFNDFAPLNSFHQFDADEWADLVHAAGAGYVVLTARHHDGWCWWDAPATSRTTRTVGPRRNVLGELFDACRERGLVTGASYSMLDWNSDDYPTSSYVRDVIHPQVLDLVSQHHVDLLYGNGHWGAGGDHWASDELLSKVLQINPSVVINDRWWSKYAMVRTYEYTLPSEILDTPWEARRGIGGGFGHNAAEADTHRLNAQQLVALYSEVIAKGGHLLLGIGPDASGRLDTQSTDALQQFGAWMATHRWLDQTRPWTTWGDAGHRYLQLDTNTLVAIDIAGDGVFGRLGRPGVSVCAVTCALGTPLEWSQTADGLTVHRRPGQRKHSGDLPSVFRVELSPLPDAPVQLFSDEKSEPLRLSTALEGAKAGDVIQLGEGLYLGPAIIPSGVTVRGLGPDRTRLDGESLEAVVLQAGARLEHVRVTGGGNRIAWLPKSAIRIRGDRAALLGCTIDGHIIIEASKVRVLSCRGAGVIASGNDNIEIRRSTFTGMGWDCSVEVAGGSGHEIEGCEFSGSLIAVRLIEVTESTVRGNDFKSRWWGVLLVECETTRVLANAFHQITRAVDVDGGTLIEVTGNAVNDGDSGCLVQRGATEVTITGNRWDSNRVGLFVWDAGNIIQHDNTCVGIADATEIWGP